MLREFGLIAGWSKSLSKLIRLQGIAHVAEVLDSVSPVVWAQSLRNIESGFESRREAGQPEAFIDGCKEAIAMVRPKLTNQAED